MKIIRERYYKRNACFLKLFSSIRSEKGQTLVEYSFLISLSAMMNSIVSFFQENLLVAFIIAALFIIMLFKKPKLFLVVILIVLLLIGVLYLISILS